ncbi:MAG: hypothetical protein K6E11_01915 [Bacilli bacterium]|nr:hypothetical protein [Bacilli bacterium]
MKKSKIVVPAVALLALGLAASTTATVAWFQATSAATLTDKSAPATVNVQSSTYSAGAYYVKATASFSPSAALDYTDKNGSTWVIVNGYLRTAAVKSAKYASVTIAVNFYSNEACTQAATVSELAEIGAAFSGLTVTINPDANTRLTTSDPSSNFATAFASKLDVSDTVNVTLSSAGAASYSNNTHYVSVNGDGTSEVADAHVDGEAAASEYTTDGGLTLTIASTARSA